MEELLTPKEVAAKLKLSEKSILDYLRDGKLTGVKVGKHWRVKATDLEAFLRPPLRVVKRSEAEDQADIAAAQQALGEPERIPYAQARHAILARLLTWKREGLSTRQMAERLQAEGMPTLSGRGAWTSGTVSRLLQEAEHAERSAEAEGR